MKTKLILAALASIALSSSAIAADKHDHDHDHDKKEGKSVGAHEHGKSELKIAIEGNEVELELESPGNDIVGFEHKAETAEQKTAVSNAIAVLEKPMDLFTPPSAAGCKIEEAEAEFEVEGEHAGFHVHWHMECADVKALNGFTVTFFDKFPAAEEVEVEAVSDGGQTAIELHHDDKKIDLSAIVG